MKNEKEYGEEDEIKGIFVLSRLYVKSDVPRQLINDVAVIKLVKGRNLNWLNFARVKKKD